MENPERPITKSHYHISTRWLYGNELSVNTKKICVIKVGSRHKANTSRDFRLRINDIMLDQVETVPYLSCSLGHYLQWDMRISPI